MGQGRKKGYKSGYNRFHRRSCALETENQETAALMTYLGISSNRRSSSFSYNRTKYSQRETPSVPALLRPPHRDSLVDYMNTSNVSKIPTKKANIQTVNSPVNQFQATDALPFICTIPLVPTSPQVASPLVCPNCPSEQDIDYLVTSIFPNNVVYMNGKGRDLTPELRVDICCILSEVFHANNISFDTSQSSIYNRKEFVRIVLFNKIDRILSSLINGCRYENIYGSSARSMLLLGICNCMPDVATRAHRVLYETLVDFYEAERENGSNCEDDIYLRDTTYGQIHRLIELWQFFVNSFYEKYSSYIFSHRADKEKSSFRLLSAHQLYQSLYVLIRISGVVSKYKSILVSNILKLFYIDTTEVHVLFHTILSKWPVSSSKKAIALLELIQDLLEQGRLLLTSEYDKDITKLLIFICQLVNSSQAEVSMQALQILDSDYILMNYIVHNNQRVRLVEQSLHNNQYHWNQVIREVGESLFDHLLDYV